ncbi:beta-galactosidase [Tessaracoccus sp. OS52]|uniref:beta-galactosidase n=1 Tax=Tessaracoccus sp. OS52 TaxID=2886691 RepID=UPI001D127882|nr:beta-galactosidase [Tessaracoccus sp. OS52]MCC2593902.1 beta-galactosidase [Tessaracoccus sp. OS52]
MSHTLPSHPAFLFGGDYNPEQWTEEVWREDVELMREAGVNTVTLGVFSWGLVEVDDDVWDFSGMDRVVELLAEAGIGIDMATPTAAPPIWLHREHPDVLPVDHRGIRYHQGGRLQWCPSNPVWQRYSARVAARYAERYGQHPAVVMWHVGNELGGGNRQCFCEHSSQAFRAWLRGRYGSVENLNQTWGTAFWGLRFRSFDDVQAPLDSETGHNPSLLLDFARFSSDALLAHYRMERDALRAAGVEAPITTNFMVATGPGVVDYASWAGEVDIVATDHYTTAADPNRERELSFVAARTRGLDPTRPWLLMEHSTSAVNWQPRNRPKPAGELARNSLQHIAHGSDGALFFQWRASAAGREQFHSAMVPHAGRDTRRFREVAELGALLGRIGEVAGSLVERSRVAILADDVSGWAWNAGDKPINGYPLPLAARRWFDALAARGHGPDVVPPRADLSGYELVVVPGLFLVDDATAAAVAAAAESGATVVVGYASGIVDEHNRVRLGGYPGAFRDLLGVVSEEFSPLQEGERVRLTSGATACDWTEELRVVDAEVLDSYDDGPLEGLPAVTRRDVGAGQAWYVSAEFAAGFDRLVEAVVRAAQLEPRLPTGADLEAVRRVGEGASWLFLINHSDEGRAAEARGLDLVSGQRVGPTAQVPAGAVMVVREER